MRTLIALLVAALLLLGAPTGVQAKPKACKAYKISASDYFYSIRPLCMPGSSLICSSSCRSHLRKVGGHCGARGAVEGCSG